MPPRSTGLGVITRLPLTTFLFLVLAVLRSRGSSGLLASTLHTFQKSTCDGKTMTIHCPKGTLTSVQFAQYGRRVSSSLMCNQTGSSSFNYRYLPLMKEDTNCLATTSLQIILDECQDKQHCKLVASTKTFQQDPCPGTTKYLEVAYKCRPNEFMSRTVCEGEQLKLSCNKLTRIVIYSALFGRTPGGILECPQTRVDSSAINRTNCQSKGALEVVMKHCHGNRKCVVDAVEKVFGNPCSLGVQKYLNVVYTCVPKRILKSTRHSKGHTKEKKKKKPIDQDGINTSSQAIINNIIIPKLSTDSLWKDPPKSTKAPSVNEVFPADAAQQHPTHTETYSPAQKEKPVYKIPQNVSTRKDHADFPVLSPTECVNVSVSIGKQREAASSGILVDWLNTFYFFQQNKEKAFLYLALGVSCGVICLLLLVIIRLAMDSRRKAKAKLDISEPVHPEHTPPPNHLEAPTLERSDSVDRIEVVRFTPRHRDFATCTLRSDIGNRSLTNYYG
ncbi:hypothetical protein CHS0354_027975 [Potamilus streckersoni]|uniref:SUEL-type lectin domain-containing protein n=1 Tax=Potamilus streckersoni TaxID=2493646 RepID=A0AAE0T4R1_9BIVA|nr:hypothetical protein CHS0354_027975 [Potamilus streckersoni]